MAYVTPGTAQAEVDSIGASTAFASTPYPGDFVVGLSGILNGLQPGLGVPEYPLAVFTSYPTVTEAGQEQGPYGITAASDPTSSHGRAAVGVATGDPQLASSTAEADAAWTDGIGTATATAEVVALAIGTVLRIGELRADAAMAVDAAGTTTKTSSLSFGSMTVGGVEVGLTESGLRVADSVLPGPDLTVVSSALEGAGVTLTYLPASESPTSITSAGLAITQAIDVPSQGRVELTMVLGQVTVAARAAALPRCPRDRRRPGASGGGRPGDGCFPASGRRRTGGRRGPAPAPATGPPVAAEAGAPAALAGVAILPSARVLYLVLALAGLAAVGGSAGHRPARRALRRASPRLGRALRHPTPPFRGQQCGSWPALLPPVRC